jgi:hypothetical protein
MKNITAQQPTITREDYTAHLHRFYKTHYNLDANDSVIAEHQDSADYAVKNQGVSWAWLLGDLVQK